MLNTRILREIKDIYEAKQIIYLFIQPIDDNDIIHKEVNIIGHVDSDYKNENILLGIKYLKDYPYKSSIYKSSTKILHSNIYEDKGEIFLNILKDSYIFLLTISNNLVSIITLLYEHYFRLEINDF